MPGGGGATAFRPDPGGDQLPDPRTAAPALQVEAAHVDPAVGEQGEHGGRTGGVGGDVAVGPAQQQLAEAAACGGLGHAVRDAEGGRGERGEALGFGARRVVGQDEPIHGGRERPGQLGHAVAQSVQFVQDVALDGHEQSPFVATATRADHRASKASRSRRSRAVSGSSHTTALGAGPGTTGGAAGGAARTSPSAARRRSSTRVW